MATLVSAAAPPILADGHPDFNGIWEARNAAYADLEDHPARLLGDHKSARLFAPAGLSVVEGRTIPYQPSALAKRRENTANQEVADPMAKCSMAGVPRSMYLNLPFEIAQTSKFIGIISEYSHSQRIVHMGGGKHPEGIEFWMGDSRGRWDGATLVIDSANFNDKTWFDMSGNFHSNALHVIERLSLADADTLQYEATIEDANVFTRPWKITMPIYRVKATERPELLEDECVGMLMEDAGMMVDPSEQPPVKK
ncbi:MAG: hypothetical protein M3N41_13345 [Acidobacteriota bacterium]|nr:hypothetical protein [Acidobacteriota bacterium]